MKLRFGSKKIVRKELTEGDWIDIYEVVSWVRLQELTDKKAPANATDEEKRKLERDSQNKFFLYVIQAWSFKDENGTDVAITEDSISNLDLTTVLELQKVIMGQYVPEKKS